MFVDKDFEYDVIKGIMIGFALDLNTLHFSMSTPLILIEVLTKQGNSSNICNWYSDLYKTDFTF